MSPNSREVLRFLPVDRAETWMHQTHKLGADPDYAIGKKIACRRRIALVPSGVSFAIASFRFDLLDRESHFVLSLCWLVLERTDLVGTGGR